MLALSAFRKLQELLDALHTPALHRFPETGINPIFRFSRTRLLRLEPVALPPESVGRKRCQLMLLRARLRTGDLRPVDLNAMHMQQPERRQQRLGAIAAATLRRYRLQLRSFR